MSTPVRAMRGAGAKPGSPPVLSTTVNITAGGAYTVAGLARRMRCGCRCSMTG